MQTKYLKRTIVSSIAVSVIALGVQNAANIAQGYFDKPAPSAENYVAVESVSIERNENDGMSHPTLIYEGANRTESISLYQTDNGIKLGSDSQLWEMISEDAKDLYAQEQFYKLDQEDRSILTKGEVSNLTDREISDIIESNFNRADAQTQHSIIDSKIDLALKQMYGDTK